ncbi:MAG TPA: SwmB domain-containing protein [Gaiellaceae bacterium]|nr:SwmB domain-containing protein [Gaiellaceae bacterium]
MQARLGADGSVGFFDPATHLLAGIEIRPVKVFDRTGKDVTPAGSRWRIAVSRGRRFLELRLDDVRLPVPYTIDPIATRSSATGSGTSGMTVAVPGTVEAGDLIVVHAAVVGGTGVSSISPSISGGGGSFSALSSQNNAGTALTQETFWKRAATSDAGATLALTWSPSSNAGAAEILVEKGVATGGTIPQASSSGASSSTTSSVLVNCPAISSSVFPQDNLGLCLGAIAVGNTWPSTSGSWSNVASKANGSSLSLGSYADLCGTSGGCDLAATDITTTGSSGTGSVGDDFDVPPDTTAPSADTITLNKGSNPSVQYFNASSGTFYFGVIPSATTFTLKAVPSDTGSGIDHVAFPDLSGTSGWSGDTGGTVNYQSSGNYTSATYTIATSPSTPAAANITATDNNGNNLNTSIGFAQDTTPPPTPSAPTLTAGYRTTASVSVTGTDTTDADSGTNAAASTMLRASATLNADGTCGSFSSFSTINGWTSGSAHSDTTVTNSHCYQYEWRDQDNVANTAASAASGTVKVDTSQPTLSTATVNGSTLTLAYTDNENLATTPPATSSYTVHVNNGGAQTPTSVTISGDTVTLTLPNAVSDGDTVVLSYALPGTNYVQDLAGNFAGFIGGLTVTNLTNTVTLGVSARSVVGSTLTIGVNEPLKGGQTPQPSDFSVSVNGSARTVSSVPTTMDDSTEFTLLLASPVATGDSVTVQYTQNATGSHQIKSRAGLDTLASDSGAQSVGNYTTVISQDSPAGYWRLGESSGTTFADSSGHNAPLTLTPPGSPSGTPGTCHVTGDVSPDAGGYQFNFDNSQLRSSGISKVDTDSNGLSLAPTLQTTMGTGYPSALNAYSLEAWVNPSAETVTDPSNPGVLVGNLFGASASGCLASQEQGTGLYYQNTQGSTEGVLIFERGAGTCPNATTQTYSTPIQPGHWYYVVGTYDGQTMKLYVDGTLISQQPKSSFSLGTSATLATMKVGSGGNILSGGHFKGTIDDAAVYTSVLSPSRIRAHYAAGLNNGSYTNPPAVPTNSAFSGTGGVTLSAFAHGGGCTSFEPPEWTSSNFTLTAARYYIDEGYVPQAEVTNATNPLSGDGAVDVAVDGGATQLFNTQNNVYNNPGWRTFDYNGLLEAPVSFLYEPECFSNTAITSIGVIFRWKFDPNFLDSLLASGWFGGKNAAEPGLCNCWQSPGDPVDSQNGDYSDTYTDAKVATYGPPLTFSRTYDASLAQAQAASGAPGPLGYGWTDNWNMSLSVNSGTVTINQRNGAVVNFKTPTGGACSAPYVGSGASGTYCALPSVTASLTFNSSNSTYTFITHAPYRTYTFNNSGQLTGESGPGAATLSLAYNTPAPGSGHCPSSAASCVTVTSASGRTLVIGSNSSNRVTSVTDPLGRSWSYGYCSPPSSTCSSGDLVSVTDPRGKVTTYTYDQSNSNSNLIHDLLTVTNPNGQPGGPDAGDSLVNVYNASGQVTSQTDPAGNQTTFDYSHLDSTGTGYTLVTDPDGNKTQYTYNSRILVGRTLGYGSSSPSTWTYRPDSSTLLDDTVVDPNGNETDYTYNSNGDLTSKTNALGDVWSYSYNSFDEQTCAALPLATDQCASLSPPAAIPAGTSTISPPGATPPKYVTYSEYDTNGNPIWTTTGDYNPGSNSASQSRTTYQLYNGQSVTLGGGSHSCSASAPNSSLPCASIDANGVVTQLGYSTSGDLTSSATPDGNPGGEMATATYDYYGDGALKTVTAPKGNLTGANAATYTTTYVYNDDNQLHTTTVSQTGGGITARTTTYDYDGNGNRISVTNPRLKTTTYSYTPDDQLTLVTDPDNQQSLTCYDGDGHTAQTVPAVGVAANSLTPASCPTGYPSGYGSRLAGDATTFAYDALGDKTIITTAAPAGQSGSQTTSNAYDAAGRLTRTTAPPASNDTGAPNQVTTYGYDDADQLTSVTKAAGTSAASTTSYCYDPNENKTATVAPDGNTSGVVNCALIGPYQTSSAYQTGYSYDSLGELVSETRPATAAAPSGQTTTYSYDPAGNLVTSQDPYGVTTTNTYTPLNQLATVSYSGSSAHSVSYSYDANGNRTSMSDASGSSTYGYNPFNELTSSQNGAGQSLAYTYNDDGETSSITYPLGAGATWATSDTVSYGYDNADELNSITDFNGHLINIGNTADGLPNSLSLGPTGDTISTTYDATDSPSDISLGNGTSSLLDFAYSNTPSGAIASETTTPTTPNSPAAYDYDAQNRVSQLTPGSGSTLNYGFDASGNLTTLPTGASGSYDNASELTSSTLAATTTNYTYDADGERTQASQGGSTTASASYNGAQEVTSYNNNSANMGAATYDGDGLRTTSTTTPAGGSGTTQTYLWDTSGSTPQLAMDSNDAYVYGAGTAPVEQVNLSSGAITYLVSDRLGSVRGTVNTSGSLTNSTSYDPWGNPQSSGGLTNSTPFGYAGNYTDSTGLTYNIRRYYDPQTGQFINVDPAVDQTEAPYAYVNGDPVDATDPLGLGCGFLSLGDCLQAGVNTFLGGTTAIGNYIANSPVAEPFLSVTTDIGNTLGGAYYDFASAHPCIALGISTTAQIAGLFVAPEIDLEEEAALVIGRGSDLAEPGALRPGEYKLSWPSKLPDYKAEWKVNSGLLRQAINRGLPIRDASPGDTGGVFLNAERNLLEDRGWSFDPNTSYWYPPGTAP